MRLLWAYVPRNDTGKARPHRGAFLSGGIGKGMGNFEFKGYITCHYHGYTFDGQGQCVAALTDGPDSKLQPKIQARHSPTRTHQDVVYIWMGETEPVPLEEDLPEEFFDPEVSIQTYVTNLRENLAHELVPDHGELPGLPQ